MSLCTLVTKVCSRLRGKHHVVGPSAEQLNLQLELIAALLATQAPLGGWFEIETSRKTAHGICDESLWVQMPVRESRWAKSTFEVELLGYRTFVYVANVAPDELTVTFGVSWRALERTYRLSPTPSEEVTALYTELRQSGQDPLAAFTTARVALDELDEALPFTLLREVHTEGPRFSDPTAAVLPATATMKKISELSSGRR